MCRQVGVREKEGGRERRREGGREGGRERRREGGRKGRRKRVEGR